MDVFTRVMYMHACTKDKKNLVDNWEAGHFKRVKRERDVGVAALCRPATSSSLGDVPTVVALQLPKDFLCRGSVFGLRAACEWDCYTRRPSTVDSWDPESRSTVCVTYSSRR